MDEQQNPYAAPQVALVEEQAPNLPGWRAEQLRLLGWLSLVSLLGTVTGLVLAFFVGEERTSGLARGTDTLGIATILLGCYLSLRLKAFAEQRFGAQGLLIPTWLIVVVSILLQAIDVIWGDSLFSGIGPATIVYGVLIVIIGIATLWLGVRLLKTQNVYPVFRVMAWLHIVGGALVASVILMVIGVLPLLAASAALALVFFRAAREQDALPG